MVCFIVNSTEGIRTIVSGDRVVSMIQMNCIHKKAPAFYGGGWGFRLIDRFTYFAMR